MSNPNNASTKKAANTGSGEERNTAEQNQGLAATEKQEVTDTESEFAVIEARRLSDEENKAAEESQELVPAEKPESTDTESEFSVNAIRDET